MRFIDNFSAGNRGAASAEYFLEAGYVIIFLHRHRSIQPYMRAFTSPLFTYLTTSDGHVQVKEGFGDAMLTNLQKYQHAISSGSLLMLSFTSVVDYIFLLRLCCQALAPCGHNAIVYLAAAVSDFYIPTEQMSEHKIQSRDGPLQLTLTPVPKMVQLVRLQWCAKAFLITFKLETLPELLQHKARQALTTYNHHLVVANLLSSHKTRVHLYSPEDEKEIFKEESDTTDIEARLVSYIAEMHASYIHAASC